MDAAFGGESYNKSPSNIKKPNDGSIDKEDQYDFSHPRRGVAVIIINEKCIGEENARAGCALDRDLLQNAFCHLGFEIRPFWDLGSKQLISELHRISKEDLSNTDCFVMAISTHGSEVWTGSNVREDTIYTKDSEMQTKLLLDMFNDKNCPSLKGKPRLLFIQACRGYKFDDGLEVHVSQAAHNITHNVQYTGLTEEDRRDAFPSMLKCFVGEKSSSQTASNGNKNTANPKSRHVVTKHPTSVPPKSQPLLREVDVRPAPCYKDFLVMYATPPGHYAFRRPSKGSWFIRCLSDVLLSVPASLSLSRQLTRVIRKVTEETSHSSQNPEYSDKKQTPVIYSMLTKDIFWSAKVV